MAWIQETGGQQVTPHANIYIYSLTTHHLTPYRAQIFLENAVTMYYMSTYYKEYCDFVLRKAKGGNALHERLDAKLRSAEMIAGMHVNV